MLRRSWHLRTGGDYGEWPSHSVTPWWLEVNSESILAGYLVMRWPHVSGRTWRTLLLELETDGPRSSIQVIDEVWAEESGIDLSERFTPYNHYA